MAKKLDRLSSTLAGLIKARGMQSRMSEYRILGQWEKAAGSLIASHARPVSVRAGKLFLVVDSPAWMQQLSLLKPELIEKVNSVLGRKIIRDIGLNLGEVQAPQLQGRQQDQPPAVALTSEDRAAIETTIAEIRDPDVRNALRRLMEKDFSRKKREGR